MRGARHGTREVQDIQQNTYIAKSVPVLFQEPFHVVHDLAGIVADSKFPIGDSRLDVEGAVCGVAVVQLDQKAVVGAFWEATLFIQQ